MSWSDQWKLGFNPEKCKVMRIGHSLIQPSIDVTVWWPSGWSILSVFEVLGSKQGGQKYFYLPWF